MFPTMGQMVYWYMYMYSIDNNDNIRQVTQFSLIFVSKLIDQATKTLKDYLVSHLFDMHTTNLIQNTIISPKLQLTPWFEREKGMVGILFTYEDRDNGILYGRSKFCRKVKNLVWRVCHDYFPSCVRLISKGVKCLT